VCQSLKQKVESLEATIINMRHNTDAAIAQSKPPAADDTLARQATLIQEEVQMQRRAAQEADKRVAMLEHALQCKDASRAAVQDDLTAVEEQKAAVVRELQGAGQLFA
jgi:hypothetical protein